MSTMQGTKCDLDHRIDDKSKSSFQTQLVLDVKHNPEIEEEKKEIDPHFLSYVDDIEIPMSSEGLAIATAVVDNEDEPDVPITFAHEVDLETKIPIHKQKCFWVFSFFLIVVVVSMTIGITLTAVKIELENDIITNAPSIASSSAPSTLRDGLGIWQTLNLTTDVDLFLAQRTGSLDDVKQKEVFELRKAPQYLAADWIINQDKRALQADDPNFIQRYSLAVLFYATLGDRWKSSLENANSFLNENHECSWYGVSCNDDNTVKEIDLALNDLRGVLPREIIHFSAVENLYFESNYIEGNLPEQIGHLKRVGELALGDNMLTGTIPQSLYSMSDLYFLDLRYNFLTGTVSDSIGEIHNLRGIYLFENGFTGTLPKAIGNLNQLRWIDVDNNMFEGDLIEFHNPKILSIELYRNNFQGTLPRSLGELSQLEILDLDENLLSGSIPEEIYHLTYMHQIRLANNFISGTLSSRIGQLKNLAYFDISSNTLTGTIPEQIGEAVSSIEILLRDNDFSGSIPSTLGDLYSLELFWTHYNPRITGEIPGDLCHLTYDHNLTRLSSDCLDIYNDPPVLCECCETCCDPEEQKCIFQ